MPFTNASLPILDSHHKYIEASDLSGAPVEHTHDAYVNGDRQMSALDLAIDQGTAHAMKALSSEANAGLNNSYMLMRGKKGTHKSLHTKLDELQDEETKAPKAKAGTAPSPFDLLCVRPFRQYTMGTGVLCKKGKSSFWQHLPRLG